jgi:hypothetical protein
MANRPKEAKLNPNPKFNLPKSKFDGNYYRKRIRELKRKLPSNGFGA